MSKDRASIEPATVVAGGETENWNFWAGMITRSKFVVTALNLKKSKPRCLRSGT